MAQVVEHWAGDGLEDHGRGDQRDCDLRDEDAEDHGDAVEGEDGRKDGVAGGDVVAGDVVRQRPPLVGSVTLASGMQMLIARNVSAYPVTAARSRPGWGRNSATGLVG